MTAASIAVFIFTAITQAAEPIDIGSRRELMVDDYLIAAMQGAAVRRMHHPVRREIAVVHDAAWEGNGSGIGSIC